jgi:superfamily II DNA or RNA helicase
MSQDYTLHDYQKKAVNFCLQHKTVFLAMDMGLGKTAVALEVIRRTKQKAIVWAPLRVIHNTWPSEIAIWAPELTYDILHGPNKDSILQNSTADILLINYDGIKWFSKAVLNKRVKWQKRLLIVDESSFVKSPTTQRFKSFKKMRPLWSDHRLCLSATPSPNGFHELWSQYFILDYGRRLYDSFYKYRGSFFHYTGPPIFKTTIRKGSYEEILKRIKDITYRLDADDYIKLPPYIHNDIILPMPRKLRRKYDELEKNFFLEFAETEATAMSAAALSSKLRQFLQGAVYTDERDGSFYPLHDVKFKAFQEIVESAAGQPILCPIQFKFERKMINAFMGKDVPCIAGGTSPKEATRYINLWNDSQLPILLCHPASLGHGTNLQAGGHIILWYGLTWSLEQYFQLNGRLRRQGQKNAVVLTRLLMEDTLDIKIAQVLKRKDATQAMLLNALRR